jgi:AcrR family transcriptional regulator
MIGKASPRWTRRKEARPAELMQAALELFVEHGFAATRLDDVARKAGVSKGTLYLYFDSKDELFKAVVREGLVPALERGEQMLEAHRGSAAQLLGALMHGWWELVGNTPYGGIPKLMISECRNFPELAAFYHDEVISRGNRLIAAALERGMRSGEFRPLDLDFATRLVLAPLMLLVVWRHSFDFCGGSKLAPEAYIDAHLELVLNGLRRAPGTTLAANDAQGGRP